MANGKGVPKNAAATIQRRTKAVQLRAAGLTWEEVAQKSGFSSKQAAQKSVKSMSSAAFILGTTRARVPSGRGMSIARPKFTWAG